MTFQSSWMIGAKTFITPEHLLLIRTCTMASDVAPGLRKLLVIIEDKQLGVSEQATHQLHREMWFPTLFSESTQQCCKQGFLDTSKHFQLRPALVL